MKYPNQKKIASWGTCGDRFRVIMESVVCVGIKIRLLSVGHY